MRYLLVLLLLVGCARNPATQYSQPISLMDFHGAACDRIGLVRDTDAWRNCVLQQYQQAENRKMDEKMEVANRQRAAGTMEMQMQQKNRPMICRWVGKAVYCN